MKRVLRLAPLAVVMAVAAVGFGVSGAAAGNGSTVLRAQFDTFGAFLDHGNTLFVEMTCDEQRVQKSDGSANESLTCRVNPGWTLPTSAVHWDSSFGWGSDFFFTPGFAGASVASSITAVLTPSGNANLTAKYDAP